MTELQKQVISAAFIILNIFSVTLTAHATYSYLDNTHKLDYLSAEAK